jgi:hypothetical protein
MAATQYVGYIGYKISELYNYRFIIPDSHSTQKEAFRGTYIRSYPTFVYSFMLFENH